ncbi:ubiquinone biosynthesis monooxygenase COQ6, mitochondrial-like isoform X2 [Watersipora subatra]|uniref:ubiquinone biosynthesis monooxygenase COQ6, mitochondrial-like isoform X2 n=1 Tax=Watersipora subatra TaxID=2589382 RepID=UPI00355B214A
MKNMSGMWKKLFRVDLTPTRCSSRGISSSIYDVVISGGGMVGAAAAAALGTGSLLKEKKVLWLESSAQRSYVPPSGYSNRVSALSPASKSFLQDLGAWSIIEDFGRVQPVSCMHVWDGCSEASITFSQPQNLAYIVENDMTLHALDTIAASSEVELAYETTAVEYITTDPYSTSVKLSTGDTVSAGLVIGADGFKSLARQSAGINTLSWGYDQVGVVATLKLGSQEGDNTTAWQRFLPTGPIAVLPISSDSSSLVWSTNPSHAKSLLSLTPESFVDAVNRALHEESSKDGVVSLFTHQFRKILSSLLDATNQSSPKLPPTVLEVQEGSRASFPYGMMHADKYVAPRLALVGDACHRMHPLAGQGVNAGFGDVECLVRTLTAAISIGSEIGRLYSLTGYETERQRHVVSIIAGVDGLYRLYSNNWTPAVLIRSIGLMGVNALPFIKKSLMNHAQS